MIKLKPATGDRTLEQYRIFPFIAWGLVIFFALFVYHITTELRGITDQLVEHSAARNAEPSDSTTN
ncbi:MAG: hypothetical protein ACOC4E_02800 [Patescibacteria group bacterium]